MRYRARPAAASASPMGKALLAMLVIVAAAVGATVAVFTVPAPAPASLSDPTPLVWAPVSTQPFFDERAVDITVTKGAPAALVAPSGGVVTASRCGSGASVASGTSPFALDGQGVLALASAVPMWRDLNTGDSGSDVTALGAELHRLGVLSEPGTTVDEALQTAFRRALEAAGIAPAKVVGIPRRLVVWIPASTVRLQGCEAAIGSTVPSGAAMATVAATVSGASVAPWPADLVAGDRVLVVGATEVAIGADGVVPGAELTKLAQLAAPQGSSEAPLKARLKLTQPQQVLSVPPASVVIDGARRCLIDESERVLGVTVLGSELGQTFVIPVDKGAALPAQVRLAGDGRRCG